MVSDVTTSAGDETALSGTIYVTPNGPGTMFVNPVFQSGDGRVYLTAGTGVGISDGLSEGEAFAQTLDEKQVVTEDGVKTEKKFKVTINVALKYQATGISIIQMSADNTPAAQADYSADHCPKHIVIDKNAAYVIVETTVDSPDGEKIIREVFAPEDEGFTTYTAREDGICEVSSTSFVWNEGFPVAVQAAVPAGDPANAYFLILKYLYGEDTALNGDTYLAVDLTNIKMADTRPFIALAREFAATKASRCYWNRMTAWWKKGMLLILTSKTAA
jgi:hypothetical protein